MNKILSSSITAIKLLLQQNKERKTKMKMFSPQWYKAFATARAVGLLKIDLERTLSAMSQNNKKKSSRRAKK